MADNFVCIGQTFLKIKPIDRIEEIEACKKDLIPLAMDYAKLKVKEITKSITAEEKKELDSVIEETKAKVSASKMERYDELGMDHFWTLSVCETGFYLVTIPNQEKDIFVRESFTSVDKLLEYYRSLDDIILNAPFVGKKLHPGYGSNAYILYDIGDQLLGILLDKGDNPIGPVLAIKKGSKKIYYEDESIPELNDPEIIRNYVRILKNRGNN